MNNDDDNQLELDLHEAITVLSAMEWARDNAEWGWDEELVDDCKKLRDRVEPFVDRLLYGDDDNA